MSEGVVLAFVKRNLPVIEELVRHANEINQVHPLPWRVREKLRTVEGHLDHAVDEIIELTSRLDTEDAEAFLEKLYPEDDS